jgi:peptide/nickel transport system permease protein
MLIYVFFFRLRLMPPPMGRLPLVAAPHPITGLMLIDTLLAGNTDHFLLAAKVLVLPAVTLALAIQAPILNLIQVSMAAAMNSDAVRTARALGLPRREVIVQHALRIAVLPVLNMIAITFGYLLSGTVLVESVFSWPGIGLYALQAMNASDYAAIQGVVLFSAMIYVAVYIALDIAQFVIDPRIRV